MIPYHLRHQLQGSRLGARDAGGLLVRGVITKVYAADDPNRRLSTISAAGYTCDVLVYEGATRTVLREVPIARGSAGLNDHDEWKPRATTIDLASAALTVSLEGGTGYVSKTHDMDGDHVLVGFLNNDLQQPVILAQMGHPQNTRKASTTDSPAFKQRTFVRGIRWGVTDGGDVDIDTTAASDGTISPNGAEVPSVGAGNVTLTMLDGQTLSILDSSLSAPEKALLGETFLTDLQSSLTEISGLLAGLGLVTPNTATFLGKIATSLATGEPYLSAHVEID